MTLKAVWGSTRFWMKLYGDCPGSGRWSITTSWRSGRTGSVRTRSGQSFSSSGTNNTFYTRVRKSCLHSSCTNKVIFSSSSMTSDSIQRHNQYLSSILPHITFSSVKITTFLLQEEFTTHTHSGVLFVTRRKTSQSKWVCKTPFIENSYLVYLITQSNYTLKSLKHEKDP